MEEEQEIEEIWGGLSEEARELLSEVLKIERENLHFAKPEGIADMIISKVEGLIK
ncbi:MULTISPECIES: hypothetical protein [unclassified Streptomyces]|uniref:hypothetical protein n=1 Tax=unclassified Streptomyces TaxID=2593676 RepID=UPI0029623E7D|nr:hypothetical protein [Streptomyces sp. N50]WOX11427.1 hypothetical protein R2B38_22505 [Streptomyces sp. N50]